MGEGGEMLLGKRPRPPMRRTTSTTEFIPDVVLFDVEVLHLSTPDQEKHSKVLHHKWHPPTERQMAAAQGRATSAADWMEARCQGSLLLSSPPGGGHRRNSGDFVVLETAPFLRACGLCKRRLGPGRDTFMYRGDIAFCSLECRQQHINEDERMEKCSQLANSIKINIDTPSTALTTAASEQPAAGDGEMVAAA